MTNNLLEINITSSEQTGNVLFLILIAIALFAGLSYVVTGSLRSSGSEPVQKEIANVDASEVTNYAVSLRTAITRMKTVNNCLDTQISFEGPPFDGSDVNYVNPSAPVNFFCHVFHQSGGGAVRQTPPPGVNDGSDYVFTGRLPVGALGVAGDPELIMILPNAILNACISVNMRAGGNLTQNPPQDSGDAIFAGQFFQGNYTAGDIIENSGQSLNDEPVACFEGGNNPAPGTYHIYYTLLER